MLFRTSYKLSDSIARATGSVYARAWRQAIFAGAVVGGSFIGQFWGLSGVAAGVLVAISLNFVLMAHLSLRLTGMSWKEFGWSHLSGAVLALVLGAGTWGMATWLRASGTSPLMLLVEIALLAPTLAVLLCWMMPIFFLGQDAQPILRALMALMPVRLQRRPLG
jgi:PST family polysaccharide transporter